MSTVSALEVSLVIGARKREPGLAAFDRFLEASRIRVVGFDAEQLRFARAAWWNFGKGRHPAALNLGDCCSYALAKASGEMLLIKAAISVTLTCSLPGPHRSASRPAHQI
jgi:ribonuclease VapC